jgi:hypothetical protein
MGPAYCSAYIRIHCLVNGLPISQQVSSLGSRPTGRPQEVDNEVNSEVADVDSQVAGGFTIILNIADEVTT